MRKILLLASVVFCSGGFSQSTNCFSNPTAYFNFGQASRGVAVGNLDGDQYPDFALTDFGNNALTWAHTGPDGFVTTASNVPISQGPRALTINDFNMDGAGDIAVACFQSNILLLMLSNGSGGYNMNNMSMGGAFAITSGFLNADTIPDIVVGNNNGSNVEVLIGNGDGTFAAPANYTAGSGVYYVELALMDSDNVYDLVVVDNTASSVSVLIGNGDGTFNPASNYIISGNVSPYSLTTGDFNNDGHTDVATANNASNSTTIFLGSSTGGLTLQATISANGGPFGITCGNYDDDNNLDIAIGEFNGQKFDILSGDGAGNFTAAGSYITSTSMGLLATADFNQDGFDDIIGAAYGFSGSGNGGAQILYNHRAKITPITPASFCPGDSAVLVANNGHGFSYNWQPSNETNDTIVVNTTTTVTLTISNVNQTCSTTVTQAVVANPLPTVTAAASPASVCSGGQTVLTGNGAQTYNWSGGVTNGVPFTPSSAGTYTVTGTDVNGCVNTATVNVNFASAPVQEICLVTTDSATGTYNIIYWEKPADMGNIDSFIVYREFTLNNYIKLAAIYKDSLSEYSDYTANPNQQGYRYKMTTIDTCGNESAMGLWHNSIHLTVDNSGNLSWNQYTIEPNVLPALGYDVYRDNSDGNWVYLSTVSGSQNTFTDGNFSSQVNPRYRVFIIWSVSCSPTRGAINTSRSNVKSPSAVGLSTLTNSSAIDIYPNPFDQVIFIESSFTFSDATFKLFNSLGQLVLESNLTGKAVNIETAGLAKGLYTYRIEGKNCFKTGKLAN